MNIDTVTSKSNVITSRWRSGWQTFRQLWTHLYRDVMSRKGLVGQLAIIYLVLSLMPVWLFVDETNQLLTEVVWWGTVVILNFLTTLLGIAVLRTVAVPAGECSLLDSLRWVLPRIFLVLLTSLAWTGLLLTGFLVFIVPALVLLGYTLLTFAVSTQEDVWGVRALVRSIELVRGVWWSVCLRVVIVMLGVMILSLIPIALLAMGMGYAVLTRDAMLESVLVYVMLGVAAAVEAVLAVVWARLLTVIYKERVTEAVPFQDGNQTRVVNMVRTAALVGWLLPLLALVMGVGYVVQTPGALERTLLYLTTGI